MPRPLGSPPGLGLRQSSGALAARAREGRQVKLGRGRGEVLRSGWQKTPRFQEDGKTKSVRG